MNNKTAITIRQRSFPRATLSCAISACIALTGTSAVVSANTVLEEITVTARKRAESVQDVPIAISAFTAEMLESKGLTDIEKMSRVVPNLNISSGNSGSGSAASSSIYLRGIGQSDFLITTDPGVGLYIDNVYFARSMGTVMELIDLETIEVLRGPQGTLFGKNTIGGALLLNSTKPGEELGGRVQFTVGEFDRLEAKGTIDIPMGDSLLSRFAVIAKTRDGYSDRAIGGRLGDEDIFGGRATFQWTPSDNGDVTLVLDSIDREATSAVTASVAYDPTAPLAGLWSALVGPSVGITTPVNVNINKPFKTEATGPNVDDATSSGASVVVNWHFDAFSLKSITAYRELETEFGRDGDSSPAQYIETHNTGNQDQFSQEFQFIGSSFDNRLDWVVGAYYFEETADDQNDVRLASGLYDALEALPVQLSGAPCEPPFLAPGCEGNPINIGLDLDFDVNNKIENESYALFVHATYALTDQLNMTGGLRYVDEQKDYTLFHNRVNAGVPLIPLTNVGLSEQETLPLLSFDYSFDDNSMAYISAAKGFKSGGFNGRPTTEAAVDSYSSEYVWSYEIGYKVEFPEAGVRLNTAAFYYDYDDIQLNSIGADDTGNLILVTENGGTAVISGLEMDLEYRPADGWSITASLGYLDAEYDELNPGVTIREDDALPNTPDLTGSMGVSYSTAVMGQNILTIRGDWTYSSSMYVDVENTEVLKRDSLSLYNARVSVLSADETWELALFGTNLSDEIYHVAGISTASSFGHAEATIARPREWGVSLSYRF